MFTIRTNQGVAEARRQASARTGRPAEIKCVFHVRGSDGKITDESDFVFWGAHGARAEVN